MNIINAVKTIFSTERQASYASSTNGVPIVAIDGTNNGQGDGCIKFSTLASVLGGLEWSHATIKLSGVNLDTVIGEEGKVSIYQVGSTCTGLPEGRDGYMVVFKWFSGMYAIQIYYDPNVGKTFLRSCRENSTIIWDSWSVYTMDMPSFYKNYGTIDALVSGLGTAWNEPYASNTEYNTHTLSELPLGIYAIYHFGVYTDRPTGVLEGTSGAVIRVQCSIRAIMTFALLEDGRFFARYGDAGSWNSH